MSVIRLAWAMDHRITSGLWGSYRRGRAARLPGRPVEKKRRPRCLSLAAPRADSITQTKWCRLTLPYASLAPNRHTDAGGDALWEQAAPSQQMLPCARS